MISLKRTIEDFDYRVMFESAVESYRALVESLERNSVSMETEGLDEYRRRLEELKDRVSQGPLRRESLRSHAAEVDVELGKYRAEVESLINGTGQDLKNVVSVLAETAESLSQRENLHGGQLSRISGSLETIARSADLQGIRTKLSQHVFELRACIDRMTQDNDGALQALQQELSGFQKKLEKVQVEASTDPLTGLANRRRAAREIAKRIREPHAFGVLLLDLNMFKQVNDTHGHGVGDRVLQIVAQRLTGQIRKNDMVCRWGGDEFVVIHDGNREDLSARGSDIAQQIGGRIAVESAGHTHDLTISSAFGWAEYREGETEEELLARADRSLYESKPSAAAQRLAAAHHAPSLVPAPTNDKPAEETPVPEPDPLNGLPGLAAAAALLARSGKRTGSWFAACFKVRRAAAVDTHYGYPASDKILPYLLHELKNSKFGGRLHRGDGSYLVALVDNGDRKELERDLRRINMIGFEKFLEHKRRASILPISVTGMLAEIDPAAGIQGTIDEIHRFGISKRT